MISTSHELFKNSTFVDPWWTRVDQIWHLQNSRNTQKNFFRVENDNEFSMFEFFKKSTFVDQVWTKVDFLKNSCDADIIRTFETVQQKCIIPPTHSPGARFLSLPRSAPQKCPCPLQERTSKSSYPRGPRSYPQERRSYPPLAALPPPKSRAPTPRSQAPVGGEHQGIPGSIWNSSSKPFCSENILPLDHASRAKFTRMCAPCAQAAYMRTNLVRMCAHARKFCAYVRTCAWILCPCAHMRTNSRVCARIRTKFARMCAHTHKIRAHVRTYAQNLRACAHMRTCEQNFTSMCAHRHKLCAWKMYTNGD